MAQRRRETFTESEPQEDRGAPGSRDVGQPPRKRKGASPRDASGVNPLPPIDPAMPYLKPGDQGG